MNRLLILILTFLLALPLAGHGKTGYDYSYSYGLGGITWLLRDDFTTDRAAGAVNGTAAEPGPGTRVVIDVQSAVTISSGKLTYTAPAVPAWNQQYCVFGGMSKVVGTMIVVKDYYRVALNKVFQFGFASTVNNYSTYCGVGGTSGGTLRAYSDGVVPTFTDIITPSPDNFSSIICVGNGTIVVFVKVLGGTTWNLCYVRLAPSLAATMYPGITYFSDSSTLESLRVPSSLWLPTPLLSHSFASALSPSDGLGHAETTGLGSGGSGVTMTGATWTVASGKAVNTPTLGGNCVDDSGFDNAALWLVGTDWSVGGGVATKVAGATAAFTTDIAGTAAVVGGWYRLTGVITLTAGGNPALYMGNAFIQAGAGTLTGIVRATNTNTPRIWGGATFAGTVDNFYVYPITLSTLFTNCQLNKSDVYASVGVTFTPTTGFQGGMVLNLDSASSPANFVIVYYNRVDGKVYADVCVGGTYTNKLAVTATYSAGANLVSRKIGNSYYVWYNNTYVGSFDISTVTGYAAVVNNTLHGLFSTGEPGEVQLDNSVVYPSGSGGEYNFLNVFTNWGLGIPKYGVPDHYQDWEKRAA